MGSTGSSATSRGGPPSSRRSGRTRVGWPYAAVAFESPKRLAASLAALARIDPARRVAVCRELTKRFEEVARGSAAELAERFDGPVKGEVTVVVGPGAAQDDGLDDAVAAVRALVAAGAARRAAADTVAGLVDALRGTSSTAARSRRPIDAVRRRRYPSFSALPAQRMKEVLRASSSRIRGDGLAALVLSGSAMAWSWPADGDVLRPFALGGDAYAAGQHRGVDVAGSEGSAVRAPAAGTVTFAGSLPTYGRGVTIATADGYAVTLVHLGSIGVGERRRGGRGSVDRNDGVERRRRASGPVRPPGRPRGLPGGGLRRPARPASTAVDPRTRASAGAVPRAGRRLLDGGDACTCGPAGRTTHDACAVAAAGSSRGSRPARVGGACLAERGGAADVRGGAGGAARGLRGGTTRPTAVDAASPGFTVTGAGAVNAGSTASFRATTRRDGARGATTHDRASRERPPTRGRYADAESRDVEAR